MCSLLLLLSYSFVSSSLVHHLIQETKNEKNEFERLINKMMKQTNKKGVEEESARMKKRMKTKRDT